MAPRSRKAAAIASIEGVSLVEFVADPTQIEPFGKSTLSWNVTAPPEVQIELSGTLVGKVGTAIVEPPSTQTYVLFARTLGIPGGPAGSAQLLGAVVVNVDLSQCLTGQLTFIDKLIVAGILANPKALPNGVKFREDPKVTVTPGQIQIHLSLKKSIISWLPDANIDIDLSFGLTVVPDLRPRGSSRISVIQPTGATRLGPANESSNVSVTEEWWVYGIPLIGWPLALALALAADDVNTSSIIQQVVDGLDGDFHPVGTVGLEKHTVTVGVDESNVAYIQADWCPPPPPPEKIP